MAGDAGDYPLAVDVYEGDTRLSRRVVPIAIVHDLAVSQASVRKHLAVVKGADVTRESILYPFDLARMINSRQRVPIRYDFNAAIHRSDDLLTSLEAGKDPLWRAKGRTEQAYNFAAAGEISPFGVYVPKTWDGSTPLKLLLILHGVNEDQESMLARAVLMRLFCRFEGITKVFVDGGYTGKLTGSAKEMFAYDVEVVKRDERHTFKVLPKRWIVERTFAWLNWSRRLSKDYELRHT